MPFAPFYEKFPELADNETRVLTVFEDDKLPPDEYGFFESYCDEPDCDCRRVFFNVIAGRQKKILAVIAYGWESKRFYEQWLGFNDPQIIRELRGPDLNLLSPQSKYAPALLRMLQTVLLKDPKYIERLKRHYAMFRQAVDQEHQQKSKPAPRPIRPKRISRNAPCPCGSGKKYKMCCGRVV